jgi:hypothetical protein
MAQWSTLGVLLGGSLLLTFAAMSGCGSSTNNSVFDAGDDTGVGEGGDDGSCGFCTSSGRDGSGSGSSSGGGHMCPPGLQCNVRCSLGTTTISGTVYDPAGKNPLFGVTVYVPAGPLPTLPRGVVSGSDACSCAALYKSGAVVSTTTDVRGRFTLKDAPVGANVPLVLQVGKWRHVVTIATVNACADNPQQSLALNATVAAGSQDSMPDIAVSTGRSDTLECLMKRIGLPDSEYVAGTATGGHVHVFSGGNPQGNITFAQTNPGVAEANPMAGAPASYQALWDSIDHLMPYDIVLLSCEGGETYNAKPPVLQQYLDAGGRAFASHFHYAWFGGPLASGQTYSAPSVWNTHLATWEAVKGTESGPDNGVIVQTLNGGSATFPKGQYLSQWLGNVGALGQNGVPAGDLSLFLPRYNAIVTPANTPSQPWITTQPPQDSGVSGTQTMYFSFDTPVGGIPAPDGGAPGYCGRAVFSDLHVDGDPTNNDTCNYTDPMTGLGNGQPPPTGCGSADLSPQEKALEFMLFDLSSCVVADDVNPPMSIPINY